MCADMQIYIYIYTCFIYIKGYADVWKSADNGSSFTLVTNAPSWSARRYFGLVVVFANGSVTSNTMILIGGTDGTNPMKDVWKSINNGLSWSLSNSNPPFAARSSPATVAFTTTIFLLGGVGAVNYNDIWQSIDLGITWNEVVLSTGSSIFSIRAGHTALISSNGLVLNIFGGQSSASASVNDIWSSYVLPCIGSAFILASPGAVCKCASGFIGKPVYNNANLDGCGPSSACVGAPYSLVSASKCICSTGFYGSVLYTNNLINGCSACANGYWSTADVDNTCTAIACSVIGYTGSSGACKCTAGYFGSVIYINGGLSGCSKCVNNGWAAAGNGVICSAATVCSGNYAGIAAQDYVSSGINTGCTCAGGFYGTATQDLSTGLLSGCAACQNGSWSFASNDIVCSVCSSPTADQFTYAVCSPSSNTVIKNCTTPSIIQYITKTCTSGSSSSIGNDSTVEMCTQPINGRYISTICTTGSITQVGSNSALSTCNSVIPTGKYVSQICNPGTVAMKGSDLILSVCVLPFAPTEGNFVKSVCTSGGYANMGTNYIVSPCGNPVSKVTYTSKACSAGSIASPGSNTTLVNCYIPTPTNILIKDCISGTYNALGGDTVIYKCLAGYYCVSLGVTPVECPAGSYCPSDSSTPTTCKSGAYCPIKSTSEVL